jgi:predicted dehydrogenase
MEKILLVGAGGMAEDYYDVLTALAAQFDIVCRSLTSAERFEAKKGQMPYTGGVSSYVASNNAAASFAIVAVGVEHLAATTEELLNAGVGSILVEKPAGLFISELESLVESARQAGAKVYVAYNRRFYSSVTKLSDLAAADGGIRSISYDFTEWSDRIAPIKKGPNVKERWVLSNSTHVIDLAFYLAGRPKEICANTSGQLTWHTSSSCFAGSGVTERDILFNYRADWDAPGRWGLVAYTKNLKLELLPLEGLVVTDRNSVASKQVELSDVADQDFKPGLYKQVQAFLNGDDSNLCSIESQILNFPFYLQIAGYSS